MRLGGVEVARRSLDQWAIPEPPEATHRPRCCAASGVLGRLEVKFGGRNEKMIVFFTAVCRKPYAKCAELLDPCQCSFTPCHSYRPWYGFEIVRGELGGRSAR